jgi:iron complex transport system permease protein
MPRALIALMVGAMLGLSGAILQSVTQNPLASPSLTGVLSGGVLAMVLWIYLGPADQQSGAILPLVSIAGGLLAGMLVYALAWHKGTDPVSLTLAGVLVAAILNAFISLVLLIDQQDTTAIITWIVGSLNGRTWVHFETLAPYALFALPIGLGVAGMANALHLGDGVAAGLGLRVEWTRGALLAAAVILAAGAVSVVGNITFVGLIAPHIARRIVGGDARRLFPFSAVFAAGLLLAADIIARTLTLELGSESAIGINNLPVGAVTAMLGALFFFYLLTRRAV